MPSGWVKYGPWALRRRLQEQAEIAYWGALGANEATAVLAYRDPAGARRKLEDAAAHRWVYQLTCREILINMDKT